MKRKQEPSPFQYEVPDVPTPDSDDARDVAFACTKCRDLLGQIGGAYNPIAEPSLSVLQLVELQAEFHIIATRIGERLRGQSGRNMRHMLVAMSYVLGGLMQHFPRDPRNDAAAAAAAGTAAH